MLFLQPISARLFGGRTFLFYEPDPFLKCASRFLFEFRDPFLRHQDARMDAINRFRCFTRACLCHIEPRALELLRNFYRPEFLSDECFTAHEYRDHQSCQKPSDQNYAELHGNISVAKAPPIPFVEMATGENHCAKAHDERDATTV